MTCCPSCGYSWIEPDRTASGRRLRRWFDGVRRERRRRSGLPAGTLADVPPGWKARLHGWESTPPRRRQQLRAYGLAESSWIYVLQHVPTTIIRVGQTELALEYELAATILVDAACPASAPVDQPPVVS
jgi:Fe2+ transport system protein FeoA